MYSQAVTHPSTNMAQYCLTSVIGRELVFSIWYGRIQERRVALHNETKIENNNNSNLCLYKQTGTYSDYDQSEAETEIFNFVLG